MPGSSRRAPIDMRFALLLLCFVLSGLAGLIYQTAWARQFSLVFGTSELAVATVLAAYMGGLTAGAAVAARWAPRVTRPVRAYALLELGIAVAALALPLGLRAATALLVRLYGSAESLPDADSGTTAIFFLVSSFLLLLVPTGLMGATLPLLTRHAVRSDREIGERSGLLYAANTVGAVLGTLLAGFWLLPTLGLRATIWVAVGANGLVFLAAMALARSVGSTPAEALSERTPAASEGVRRRVLWLIAISGMASFTYEVLWTRLLGHLLGGTIYAFATMLASFLTGIALGSAIASRFATERGRAIRAFAGVQIGTASLSLLAYALMDPLPALAQGLKAAGMGRLAADAVLAALVLLPSALCIGATFPLAVRIAARDERDAGPATGRVYAANTAGAIVGAVAAAFWIVPAAGLVGTVILAAMTNLLLAIGCAFLAPPVGRRLAFAAGCGLLVCLAVRPSPPWNLLTAGPLSRGGHAGEPVFYEVGRSATVLVRKAGTRWTLMTNGLPEARVQPPGELLSFLPERWLTRIAHLARPEMRSLLVIGLGGGSAVERLPASIASVDVVELEPQVLEANRFLASRRASDPLSDPRVAVHLNDARGALVLAGRRFDAIVSQPSHPWTTGASHLFTQEFFELARSRLEPGGVLAQWMSSTFLDEELLRAILATLVDVFPNVRLYAPGSATMLLFLASEGPLDLDATAPAAIALDPDGYGEIGLLTREDVAASLLLDEDGARRFAAGGARIRDDRNLLQMRTGRILGNGMRYPEVARRLSEYATWDLDGLEAVALSRRLYSNGDRVRLAQLLEAMPAGADRAAARGWAHAGSGHLAPAGRSFDLALAEDEHHTAARAGILELRARPRAGENGAAPFPLDGAPTARERTILAGWSHRARGAWPALQALDEELAGIDPGDPFWEEAVRLRVAWRIEIDPVAEAETGHALLVPLLARRDDPGDFVLRARLGAAAGQPRVVHESIRRIADRAQRIQDSPRLAELRPSLTAAHEILGRLAEEDPSLAWVKPLDERVVRLERGRTGGVRR